MKDEYDLQHSLQWSYALGGFGKNIAYGFVATYTLYYYNAVVGINASFIGFLLMIARIFDAFNDPVMGIVVTKTRSKWGRYKPWIFSGALLNALVLFAMFSVPISLTEGEMKFYVAITYLLCGVTYTLSDIPYWAVIPAITRPGIIRDKFTMQARTMAGIGAAVPTVITIALVHLLDLNERVGFSKLAFCIALLYVITTLIMLRYLPNDELEAPQDIRIKEMLFALVSNDRAIWISLVLVFFSTGIYLTTNLLIYLFRFDIGIESQYTYFMMFSAAIQFISMTMGYLCLRKKFSNVVIYGVGCVFGLIGYGSIFFLLGVKSLTMVHLLLPGACISVANGFNYILTTIFIADAVDYGQKKTGKRQDSMIVSFQTLMVKLSSALAVFIAGIGIEWCGLDQSIISEQSADAIINLRLLFSMPSFLCILIASILFYCRFVRKKTP